MLFEKIQLEPNERVIKMVRRHWFLLAVRVLGVLFGALLPLLLWPVLTADSLGNTAVDLSRYRWHFLFFYSIWLLGALFTLAHIWTDYYLDLWVITDRRLISVEQVALFWREIGSFRLERLQDLNIEINGVLQTLLNYGTIEAQTASFGEDEFRVFGLPDPRGLKSVILSASDTRMHAMGVKR